jgi:hypothetical protein
VPARYKLRGGKVTRGRAAYLPKDDTTWFQTLTSFVSIHWGAFCAYLVSLRM